MQNLEAVKSAIVQYEAQTVPLNETISRIKSLTGKDVSKYDLDNYYAAQDLDSFCKVLCIQPIENWQDIDDAQALALIQEIFSGTVDDAIISRNTEALEKRYSKSSGTVNDLIFYDNLNDKEVLDILKKQSSIGL